VLSLKINFMNKYIITFFLLLNTFIYGQQDSIRNLNEVMVYGSNKNNVKKILKKIKKSCINNYEFEERLYQVSEISIMDQNDTLIRKNKEIQLFVKSLNNNFSKNDIQDEKNIDFKSIFFSKYINIKDSPLFWISEALYRKNLNILNFDFFNNISSYDYEIIYCENKIKVQFKSKELYNGYFICDNQNYNLIEISFKNSTPYPFFVSSSKNGKKESVKNWKYEIENTLIEFGNNISKFYIKSIFTNEVINNYTFEKFDKKEDTIFQEGPFQFTSILNLQVK